MPHVPTSSDDKERELARGGKATAIWTLSLALFVVAGAIALAVGLRSVVSPPTRPGAARDAAVPASTSQSAPPSP
jgi:hypothetical protein